MLPSVVRFNAADPAARNGYAELCAVAGLSDTESLASALEKLLALSGLAAPLRSFGVTAENIPILAEEAACQWTVNFNPRAIATADFAKIYASLL